MEDTHPRRGHAFLSYVREDSSEVDVLQHALEEAGVRVWRDTRDLWPGEDWRARIRDAITGDALVFIACFSLRSVTREKSYQNEELALAIDQLRLRRPDVPWLIPVRLEECAIPDHDIGRGRTLSSIQRADLFGEHRDEALSRLVAAVLRILGQHGTSAPARIALDVDSLHGTKHANVPSGGVLPEQAGQTSTNRTGHPDSNMRTITVGQACYTWAKNLPQGRIGYGFVAVSPSLEANRLWLENVTKSVTHFVGNHSVVKEDREIYRPIGRHVSSGKSLAYRKVDSGLDGYGRSGCYLIHFLVAAISDLTLSDVMRLSPSIWMDADKFSIDQGVGDLVVSELLLPSDLQPASDVPRIVDALAILAEKSVLEVTKWNKVDMLNLLGSAPAWVDISAKLVPQWTAQGPVTNIMLGDEVRARQEAGDHRSWPSQERLLDVRNLVSNCSDRTELLAAVRAVRARRSLGFAPETRTDEPLSPQNEAREPSTAPEAAPQRPTTPSLAPAAPPSAEIFSEAVDRGLPDALFLPEATCGKEDRASSEPADDRGPEVLSAVAPDPEHSSPSGLVGCLLIVVFVASSGLFGAGLIGQLTGQKTIIASDPLVIVFGVALFACIVASRPWR
jgi:TIR domain